MKTKLKLALVFIAFIAMSVSGMAKVTKPPKLKGYVYTSFGSTSNEIFASMVPYTQLPPEYKAMVNKYKPLLIKQLAFESDDVITGYHVKRAALSPESELETGEVIIYYETIYSKNLCEVSAVTVSRNGDYGIISSLC